MKTFNKFLTELVGTSHQDLAIDKNIKMTAKNLGGVVIDAIDTAFEKWKPKVHCLNFQLNWKT